MTNTSVAPVRALTDPLVVHGYVLPAFLSRLAEKRWCDRKTNLPGLVFPTAKGPESLARFRRPDDVRYELFIIISPDADKDDGGAKRDFIFSLRGFAKPGLTTRIRDEWRPGPDGRIYAGVQFTGQGLTKLDTHIEECEPRPDSPWVRCTVDLRQLTSSEPGSGEEPRPTPGDHH